MCQPAHSCRLSHRCQSEPLRRALHRRRRNLQHRRRRHLHHRKPSQHVRNWKQSQSWCRCACRHGRHCRSQHLDEGHPAPVKKKNIGPQADDINRSGLLSETSAIGQGCHDYCICRQSERERNRKRERERERERERVRERERERDGEIQVIHIE